MADSKLISRRGPWDVAFLVLLFVVPMLNLFFKGVTFDLQYNLGFAFDFCYIQNAETGETRLTLMIYHFSLFFTPTLTMFWLWRELAKGLFKAIIFICFMWLCKECIDVILYNNHQPYSVLIDYGVMLLTVGSVIFRYRTHAS